MKLSGLHISKIGQYLLVFMLFVYIIWRANSLSFTHDEAFTYKFLIGTENPLTTANNHILNTQLMGVSKLVFGMDEFSLRLPNVLAFLLYVLGYFLITTRTQIKHSWLLFSLYFFNPFVLDFFSLARGYGLSMGFISLSLYGLIRFSGSNSSKQFSHYFLIAIIFGGLALLANLSVINYFLVIVGYGILLMIKNWTKFDLLSDKKSLIKFSIGLLVSIALIYFSVDRLLYLKSLNQLYFGAYSFEKMINSITADSLYGLKYPEYVYDTLRFSVYMFFIIGLVVLLQRIKKIISQDILVLFPLIILGYWIENLLFEAKFPMGRTTLYIYVLFLFFASKSIKINNLWLVKILKYSGLVLSILVIFHFSKVMNYNYVGNWKYDASTAKVMREVAKLSKGNEIDFATNWLFEPAANYYIDLYEINSSKLIKSDLTPQSDYLYEFSNKIDTSYYQIIKEYPLSESVFAKRK